MTDRPGDDLATTHARRTVLKSVAVAGVAVPFLAACGSDSDSTGADGVTPETPSSGATGSESGGGNGGDSGGDNGGGDGGKDADIKAPNAIAETGDVPKGGGVILDDPGIVITQPSSGEFKGFSPICTHMGCTVSTVSGGTINCLCHGSMYSIEDGSVVAGPAPSPLPAMDISVKGNDISLA